MMASSLSNISIYTPFSSERISSFSIPPPLRTNGRAYCCNIAKAMAGERKDNLDHLQRVTQQQQPQLKKRLGQGAPTGSWDRFPIARTLQQMMDTMEKTMEDPLAYSSARPLLSTRERNGYNRGRIPWEIKEDEYNYKMRFDIPGMNKNDVKVWVEEKMLLFKAEKVPKNDNGGESKAQEEDEWPAESYGKYTSRIALPENLEFEKIAAEVKDGVLYVKIPKSSTTSKIININVE